MNSTTVRATQRNPVSPAHTKKTQNQTKTTTKPRIKSQTRTVFIYVRADETSEQHRQTVWAKGTEQLGVLKTIIPVQFCESGILHCNFSREMV